MRLQCDQHEFMQAWFLPVQNPYHAKVTADGTFTIKDIPTCTHAIMAWHPVVTEVEHTIDIPEGQTGSRHLSFHKTTVNRISDRIRAEPEQKHDHNTEKER